jgi:hypothetical protein
MSLRLAYCTIGFLALALLISALLCEQPIPDIKPKQTRLTQQADSESGASEGQGVAGAAPSSPTVKTTDGQKPAEDKRNAPTKAIEYWWRVACWLATISGQTYFIFLTAVFTGLLALYTYQLVGATGFAAYAAGKSAEAADRQGNILVGIERPWVISIKPDITNGWPLPEKIDKPIDIRFSYRIVNVGNSPAFLNYFWRRGIIVPMPRPPELPKYGKSRFPPFIIPPKGEHGDGDELLMRDIDVDRLQQIRAGKLVIIFYGKVCYESRISKTEMRTSQFCHVWGYDDGKSFYDPSGPEGWTNYT